MRLEGYAEARVDNGKMLRLEHCGLAVWIAYSGHEKDGNMAWFDFRQGSVVVKNPDSEILMKMWFLRKRLLRGFRAMKASFTTRQEMPSDRLLRALLRESHGGSSGRI